MIGPSMAEKLHDRLTVEEQQMLALQTGECIKIKGLGERPYRKYRVTVVADSYLKGDPPVPSCGPHSFTISAPADYPLGSAPIVHFESAPVAHVNIFTGGNVCIGAWSPRESLASETVRTIRLILLDPATFNFNSPADSGCVDFCRGLRGRTTHRRFRLPAPPSPAQLAGNRP